MNAAHIPEPNPPPAETTANAMNNTTGKEPAFLPDAFESICFALMDMPGFGEIMITLWASGPLTRSEHAMRLWLESRESTEEQWLWFNVACCTHIRREDLDEHRRAGRRAMISFVEASRRYRPATAADVPTMIGELLNPTPRPWKKTSEDSPEESPR